MMPLALLLTYLGVALLYAASPATPGAAPVSPRSLRGAGGLAVACALALFGAEAGAVVGGLVGLSALMLAASVLVIAGPLVPRFLPVSLTVAVAFAAVAWIL